MHTCIYSADRQYSNMAIATGYQLGMCHISQMTSSVSYDYEYIGAVSRLVVTPQTERACFTLTAALANYQCGSLVGPPGSGKSATIVDLAKVSFVSFGKVGMLA
jgi:hypothetical protein